MTNELYRIKTVVYNLEKNISNNEKLQLLQDLVNEAEAYKKTLMNMPTTNQLRFNSAGDLNIITEKISEETFLYKSVMAKDVYEGDYLERFSMIRTSDLKTAGVLDIHNRFWKAHEVYGSNIFATLPLALINDEEQIKILKRLNWNRVHVDVYEIKNDIHNNSKGKIISAVERLFDNYILVREVYGDILMILHFKDV
ncbi:hypothetical protein F8154_12705 [Alkaliphilus pronyensis]|uniref:Uncharacterized protein n=1 Tax=Alkaliphilus pronyensis TaxID=1482732 RepID=A0A6I0EWG5_9FIRM|nr:hypothetical protein [Alkaliphilus pronyensis]KAB3531646.1 hypothetical protein F8154_12705 [Alkaliphilus pronyensis]